MNNNDTLTPNQKRLNDIVYTRAMEVGSNAPEGAIISASEVIADRLFKGDTTLATDVHSNTFASSPYERLSKLQRMARGEIEAWKSPKQQEWDLLQTDEERVKFAETYLKDRAPNYTRDYLGRVKGEIYQKYYPNGEESKGDVKNTIRVMGTVTEIREDKQRPEYLAELNAIDEAPLKAKYQEDLFGMVEESLNQDNVAQLRYAASRLMSDAGRDLLDRLQENDWEVTSEMADELKTLSEEDKTFIVAVANKTKDYEWSFWQNTAVGAVASGLFDSSVGIVFDAADFVYEGSKRLIQGSERYQQNAEHNALIDSIEATLYEEQGVWAQTGNVLGSIAGYALIEAVTYGVGGKAASALKLNKGMRAIQASRMAKAAKGTADFVYLSNRAKRAIAATGLGERYVAGLIAQRVPFYTLSLAAANDMMERRAAMGGDVSSWEAWVTAMACGVAYTGIEHAQVGQAVGIKESGRSFTSAKNLLAKSEDAYRKAIKRLGKAAPEVGSEAYQAGFYDYTFRSILPKVYKAIDGAGKLTLSTVDEIGEEALQDAIAAGYEAAGVEGRNVCEAMGAAFVDTGKSLWFPMAGALFTMGVFKRGLRHAAHKSERLDNLLSRRMDTSYNVWDIVEAEAALQNLAQRSANATLTPTEVQREIKAIETLLPAYVRARNKGVKDNSEILSLVNDALHQVGLFKNIDVDSMSKEEIAQFMQQRQGIINNLELIYSELKGKPTRADGEFRFNEDLRDQLSKIGLYKELSEDDMLRGYAEMFPDVVKVNEDANGNVESLTLTLGEMSETIPIVHGDFSVTFADIVTPNKDGSLSSAAEQAIEIWSKTDQSMNKQTWLSMSDEQKQAYFNEHKNQFITNARFVNNATGTRIEIPQVMKRGASIHEIEHALEWMLTGANSPLTDEQKQAIASVGVNKSTSKVLAEEKRADTAWNTIARGIPSTSARDGFVARLGDWAATLAEKFGADGNMARMRLGLYTPEEVDDINARNALDKIVQAVASGDLDSLTKMLNKVIGWGDKPTGESLLDNLNEEAIEEIARKNPRLLVPIISLDDANKAIATILPDENDPIIAGQRMALEAAIVQPKTDALLDMLNKFNADAHPKARATIILAHLNNYHPENLVPYYTADVETKSKALAKAEEVGSADTIEALSALVDKAKLDLAISRAAAPYIIPITKNDVQFSITAVREYNEVVEKYKDTDKWLKAPNGKKTNLTERQWVIVRTPSFKAWFGDWENDPTNASKVVDLNGEPLVVFHGSKKKFNTFEEGKIGTGVSKKTKGGNHFGSGFYFTPTYFDAQKFGRNVVEVFLNIKNPAFSEAGVKEGTDGIFANGFNGREYVAFSPTQIKSATDNVGMFDPSNPDIRYSLVADKQKIAELDASPKTTGYRTVVLHNDGTLGSPMASGLRNKGKGKQPTGGFIVGAWEQAEERPELANDKGKIDLVKPSGKAVGGVDYNPYIHSRLDCVNAQFKDAWQRPDLVYIQNEIPQTDLDSGYHADKAAKPVGIHKWNGGDLILSRYDKPIRVVPWEEVADDWVKKFKDRGVEFDIVSPQLLPILEERGIEILPPHKNMGEECNEAYKAWKENKRVVVLEPGNADIRYSIAQIYTGSSANYDKPSLHKIGTGEGNQVYGWGLYGTNRRGIAEHYAYIAQDSLENYEYEIKEEFREFIYNLEEEGYWDEAPAELIETAFNHSLLGFDVEDTILSFKIDKHDVSSKQEKQKYQEAIDLLTDNKDAIQNKINELRDKYEAHEYVYEQTFFTNRPAGDESHLLKWYEPVSEEQKDWVISRLNFEYEFAPEEQWMLDALRGDITGEKFYGAIEDIIREKDEYAWDVPRATSELLSRADIDGVKYPAQSYNTTIKDGDKYGWNYVSFRDDNINVDHKWVDGEQRYSITLQQDAAYLDDAVRLPIVTAPRTESGSERYSVTAMCEATGIEVEMENETPIFYRGGIRIENDKGKLYYAGEEVTDDIIREWVRVSPIGALLYATVDNGFIDDQNMEHQLEFFASLIGMIMRNRDVAMTQQFVGSLLFTAMKENADKQYKTTYDIVSICTKTQAVIDAMSAAAVAKSGGLTTDEILQIYREVAQSGLPVPCPECYVFSRWIGIGGLLDNINKYQQRFGVMTPDEVQAKYQAFERKIRKVAKENDLSFGKAKGKVAAVFTKDYKKLLNKVEKARNQGEEVSKKDEKDLAIFEANIDTVKAMTWISDVYFTDSKMTTRRENFAVPNDILFDLNRTEEFAMNYPQAWAFRCTQGAGYGKAITPYAEAVLGEGISVEANKRFIKDKQAWARQHHGERMPNAFLNLDKDGKLTKDSLKKLAAAIKNEYAQAFIGGQRIQSTSDARPENMTDYIITFLELQAMGAFGQGYTKVLGAIPALCTAGFAMNMSMMPLGGGLDKNGVPIDTSWGGVPLAEMLKYREQYERAGSITVGVNDNHIRALMHQIFRDFIIPYHASGGKRDVVNEMRRIQERLDEVSRKRGTPRIEILTPYSSDYTSTQSEKVLSELRLTELGYTPKEIELVAKRRAARIAILTGKGPKDMGVIKGSKFLSHLYDMIYDKDGEWYGVRVPSTIIKDQIFPNEYWDKTLTQEQSGKITKDYLEYCHELGFLHKFSGMRVTSAGLKTVMGYNEKGEKVPLQDLAYVYDANGNKTDQIEDFYWRLIVDRRMYDNQGKYLEQTRINLNSFDTDLAMSFANYITGAVYDQSKSHKLAKKIGKSYANVQNPDIRYSIQQDNAYLDAVKRGDMDVAQRMVEKAARLAGYIIKAYHGTPNYGFWKFSKEYNGQNSKRSRKWFSFTSSNDIAKAYSKLDSTPSATKAIQMYNKLMGQFDVSDDEYENNYIDKDAAYDALDIDIDRSEWENEYGDIQDEEGFRNAEERAETKAYIDLVVSTLEEAKDVITKDGFAEAADNLISELLQGINQKPGVYEVFLSGGNSVSEFTVSSQEEWDRLANVPDATLNSIDSDLVIIHRKGEGDLFFVKNPNQIKSADPVIYDDNGNVIPLSQRFNADNPDIRFSIGAMNDLYEHAIKSNNSGEAKEILDHAASMYGYTVQAYHGTRDANIKIFKRNFNYFSSSRDVALSYAPNNDIIPVYLKMEKPFVYDAESSRWSAVPVDKDMQALLKRYGSSYFNENGRQCSSVADIVAAVADAVDEGEFDYDSIIIRNVEDTGSYGETNEKFVADDYIPLAKSQIKSAELATYDDNGNLISLAERFNDSTNDIRYSLSATDDNRSRYSSDTTAELVLAAAIARSPNQKISTEQRDKLLNIFTDLTISPDDIEARALKAISDANAKIEKEQLSNTDIVNIVNEMYDEQLKASVKGATEKGVQAGARIANAAERAKTKYVRNAINNAKGKGEEDLNADIGDLPTTIYNALINGTERPTLDDIASEQEGADEESIVDTQEDETRTNNVRGIIARIKAAQQSRAEEEAKRKAEREAELARREAEQQEQYAKDALEVNINEGVGGSGVSEQDDINEEEQEDDETFEDPNPTFNPTLIPVEFFTEAGLDIRDGVVIADLIREWCRVEFAKALNLDVNNDVFARPKVAEQYRKTVINILGDMARRLMSPDTGAKHRVDKMLAATHNGLSVDEVFNRTAMIAQTIIDNPAGKVVTEGRDGVPRTRMMTSKQIVNRLRKELKIVALNHKSVTPLMDNLKRKVSARLEKRAKAIRHALSISQARVDIEIADLSKKLQDGGILDPELKLSGVELLNEHQDMMIKLQALQEFGGLKYKLPGEVLAKRKDILGQLSQSKQEIEEKMIARESLVNNITQALTTAIYASNKNFVPEADWISDTVDNAIATLRERLEFIISGASGKVFSNAQKAVDDICLMIAKANEELVNLKLDYQQDLDNAIAKIVGDKNAGAYEEHLHDYIPEQYAVILSKTTPRTRMTYGQALHLWGYLKQADHYGENIQLHGRQGHLDILERLVLTPEDIAFGKELIGIYDARRAQLSKVMEEYTGLPVYSPSANYMPVSMKRPARAGLDAQVLTFSAFAKSLTPRTKNDYDVDEEADVLMMYKDRSDDTARAISFGMTGILLSSILGSSEFKNAVNQNYGKKVCDHIIEQVTDAATDGKNDGSTKDFQELRLLTKLRSWAAISALSWNMSPALKQLVSVPNWAMAADSRARGLGWRKALTMFDLDSMYELSESKGFRARYGATTLKQGFISLFRELANLRTTGNINRDYQDARNAWKQHVSLLGQAVRKVALAGMAPMQLADIVPSMIVGTGMYKHLKAKFYEEHKLAGLSDAEATEKAKQDAATTVIDMIEDAQQSSRMDKQTRWYRHGGDLGKAFTMFASAANLQLSHEIAAARNLANKLDPQGKNLGNIFKRLALNNPISLLMRSAGNTAPDVKAARKKLLNAVLINHLYTPVVMSAVSELWHFLLAGWLDDDDEWLQDWAYSLIAGTITGPYATWWLVGSTLNYSLEALLGVKSYGTINDSAAIQLISKVADGCGDVAHEMYNANWDEALHEALSTAGSLTAPTRNVKEVLRKMENQNKKEEKQKKAKQSRKKQNNSYQYLY